MVAVSSLHEIPQEFSHVYRSKSRWQLIRISAAVMGIEFCYAAETAFVSPALLKIGVSHGHMTLIWCISPLIGFFLTPVLGSLSDRCYSSLGRRRPFILALSFGIILGLLLVPNGKDIGMALGDDYHTSHVNFNDTVATLISALNNNNNNETIIASARNFSEDESHHVWSIFFTVIGTVLLDFDADACQSPSRAYMLDVTIPEDHTVGLSTFTIMAGLGGSMGYAMGAIDWESTVIGHAFGGHMRSVFTLILFIFIGCVIVTVVSFAEIPLRVIEKMTNGSGGGGGDGVQTIPDDDTRHVIDEHSHQPTRDSRFANWFTSSKGYRRFSADSNGESPAATEGVHHNEKHPVSKCTNYGAVSNSKHQVKETSFNEHLERQQSTMNADLKMDSHDNINPEKILVHLKSISVDKESITLKHYLLSIIQLPRSLRTLCLTNLFCWMSIISYSLYFTDFVGEAVFDGDPTAADDSASRQLYENGIRFGCWGMAVYSLSCAIYSFYIDILIRNFQTKTVYVGGQLVYSVGMLVLALSRHKVAVVLLSATTGIMYATVFTMPYILVAQYHTYKMFDIPDQPTSARVRGIGTDVAIVSSMVFLAQFILSACMGTVINITGSTVSVIAMASMLSLCGAMCATQVTYLPQ